MLGPARMVKVEAARCFEPLIELQNIPRCTSHSTICAVVAVGTASSTVHPVLCIALHDTWYVTNHLTVLSCTSKLTYVCRKSGEKPIRRERVCVQCPPFASLMRLVPIVDGPI